MMAGQNGIAKRIWFGNTPYSGGLVPPSWACGVSQIGLLGLLLKGKASKAFTP